MAILGSLLIVAGVLSLIIGFVWLIIRLIKRGKAKAPVILLAGALAGVIAGGIITGTASPAPASDTSAVSVRPAATPKPTRTSVTAPIANPNAMTNLQAGWAGNTNVLVFPKHPKTVSEAYKTARSVPYEDIVNDPQIPKQRCKASPPLHLGLSVRAQTRLTGLLDTL
jgi:hypothetical protein